MPSPKRLRLTLLEHGSRRAPAMAERFEHASCVRRLAPSRRWLMVRAAGPLWVPDLREPSGRTGSGFSFTDGTRAPDGSGAAGSAM